MCLWVRQEFLDTTPNVKHIKEKKLIIRFHQIKHLCVSRETIQKMKKQVVDWETMFTHCISGKRLVLRIYKNLTMQ